MINILLILTAAIAATINVINADSCSVTKKTCWNGGCTIEVRGQFKKGEVITVYPQSGSSVDSIWNAVKQSGCGSTSCKVTVQYDTDNFGFNLRGGSDNNPSATASCNGGSSGGGSGGGSGGEDGGGSGGGGDGGGTSGGSTLKPTTSFKSSYDRLVEFVNKLTTVLSGKNRVVHSSGGAAGGVISEGQGYGLLIAGGVVASLPAGSKRDKAIELAVGLFNGWKAMCQKSKGGSSCQSQAYCSSSPCLPHWKFDDSLDRAVGTGAAPDGDEDAILGMILLVKATEGKGYSWWNEISNWAYSSCKAFMDYNTVEQNSKRILKLGSCWGGWDCVNPSYFSPGHWRVFRNFMIQKNSNEGNSYKSKWNNLIKTSYEVLEANQCSSTGLVTNWWKPSSSNPSGGGSTGCSGSGTPAAEFGAEASRTMFRIALDYIWYAGEATEGVGAKTFCNRVAKGVASKVISNFNLQTGCKVQSIHSGWLDNAFMWAPTATCLAVPGGDSQQGSALNKFASKLNSAAISDYYAGSWVALSTLTLKGDFEKAKTILP